MARSTAVDRGAGDGSDLLAAGRGHGLEPPGQFAGTAEVVSDALEPERLMGPAPEAESRPRQGRPTLAGRAVGHRQVMARPRSGRGQQGPRRVVGAPRTRHPARSRTRPGRRGVAHDVVARAGDAGDGRRRADHGSPEAFGRAVVPGRLPRPDRRAPTRRLGRRSGRHPGRGPRPARRPWSARGTLEAGLARKRVRLGPDRLLTLPSGASRSRVLADRD